MAATCVSDTNVLIPLTGLWLRNGCRESNTLFTGLLTYHSVICTFFPEGQDKCHKMSTAFTDTRNCPANAYIKFGIATLQASVDAAITKVQNAFAIVV